MYISFALETAAFMRKSTSSLREFHINNAKTKPKGPKPSTNYKHNDDEPAILNKHGDGPSLGAVYNPEKSTNDS
ncbi:hypothetical protein Q1695_004435 [Nippostrongylus brasiliensis]|nr:hypothetical protein Q1695_004435 [Nippostrongylus brasiliensis]